MDSPNPLKQQEPVQEPLAAAERFRALDAVAVRAQAVRDPAALFPAVGDALATLGLQCQIFEWNAATDDVVLRYTSLSPALRRATEVVLGRPVEGLRLSASRVPSLSTALMTGQAVYLAAPEEDFAAALSWLPRTAARHLMRLLGLERAIVAPLRTGRTSLGILAVHGRALGKDDMPFMASLGAHVGEALAAARTLETARQREAAALALGELSARVSAGATVAELPALAVRALRQPLGAGGAAVWLLDNREPVLRLAAHEGIPEGALASIMTVPLEADRLAARVAREGRTLALGSLDSGDDLPQTRVALAGAGYGLAITAPLRAGGRIVGALSLSFVESRPALSDECAFVETVATQVAAALENARLLAEMRLQAARAALLADLAALFNRSLDTPTLLATLAQKTSEVLGGTAAVYRAREGRDDFEVAALYHPDPTVLARTRRALQEVPPRPGVGVFGRAYEERRPLLVHFDDPTLTPAQRAYADRLGTTSVMGIPLIVRGQPLGVLTITSVGDERLFDEEDLTLATAIGNLAAQSLDNARAYATAEAERHRLAATIESMVDPVFLYDADGRVIDLNAAAIQMLGVASRAEALRPAEDGPQLMEMRHPDGRPMDAAEMASVRAAHGETVVGVEALLRNPVTGQGHQLIVNAAPVHDDTGRILGAVLVAHDVTALRAAERAKDEFLSAASHELRTPLTPIKGFVQIMRDTIARTDQDTPLDRDRLQRYLRMMEGRVDRLIELIGAMLDLSRLQSGPLPLNLGPADLVLLTREVLSGFEATMEAPDQAHHRLLLEAPGPILAHCDALRIEQVLTNLVANALKYSPVGGLVRIRVEQEGDQAVLTVEDEGIGIPAGEEELLFQPFMRGSNAPTAQYPGVGLGLYICREIVNQHGGRISAGRRDPDGKRPGTVIRVTLPLAGPGNA